MHSERAGTSTRLPSIARTFRERRVVQANRLDDGGRLFGVGDDRVVERAVRLDVAHPVSSDPGKSIEGCNLVYDLVSQLNRVGVDAAPSEADQIAVPDLRPDRHAAPHRFGADPSHDRRVAGVESAGDVGTRDDAENGLVVTEGPDPESLAKVAVQVEYRHQTSVTRVSR